MLRIFFKVTRINQGAFGPSLTNMSPVLPRWTCLQCSHVVAISCQKAQKFFPQLPGLQGLKQQNASDCARPGRFLGNVCFEPSFLAASAQPWPWLPGGS